MIKKKIKLAMATLACAIMMVGNPNIAYASETNQDNVVVDEAETVDAGDTSVGVHDGKVMLNEKNFPDETLRTYLAKFADEEGFILISEVDSLLISDVQSLKGVEYFTSVHTVSFSTCNIDGFDFSTFTNLVSLNLYNCDINEIDISENTTLRKINFRENGITELDISKNVNLVEVSIGMEKLTKIDFTNNVNVESLNLYKMPITEINVSTMKNLRWLFFEGTDIATINVSNNSKLREIIATDSKLTVLDLKNNTDISYLDLRGTEINNLDLSNHTKMSGLEIDVDMEEVVLNKELENKISISFNTDKTYGFVNLDMITGLDTSGLTEDMLSFEVDECRSYNETVDGTYVKRYVYEFSLDNAYINYRFYEYLEAPSVTTTYHTHIQTLGDSQGTKKNGEMAGTSGMAKRLENIWIKVEGNKNLGIQYSTHCQTYGWMPWSCDGESNGTSGEAKRLEAIKIQLTGADKDNYDVYYRVHAQSYGWLGWAKNGEPSGTAGYGKRLEGIQIVVLKKDEAAPGLNYAGVDATSSKNSNNPYIAKTNETITIPGNTDAPNVMYKTHVQTFGWQKWMVNGQMSGTSGKSKRLEGINIKLTNAPYKGDIVYTTHVQKYGWKDGKPEADKSTWKKNGEMSGTNGEAKRLEAICIDLTGDMAEHYDIYYRVHAQTFGWLGWAKNGEESGTAGYAKRLEGIQIVLVPKGGAAPADNYGGITSKDARAYISK
ncbi:MAG: hypothetical protein IJO70_10870 [Lachnospiraceae bacterium]|nr:hypothetical protein [Lachnospiraceae bacterium]